MRPQSRQLVLLVVVLYAACMCWVWWAGKDLNWDQFNYHLYSPQLMLQGRWKQDYFAASLPSYLNPIAYVPFFLMVSAGWNDFLIAASLATIHFVNVILTIFIARSLLPTHVLRSAHAIALATVLAVSAPIFLLLLGSSFIDPLSSTLTLGSLTCLLYRKPQTSSTFAIAGFLLGMATGIKLTNGVFLLALCAALPAFETSRTSRTTRLFRQIIAVSLGALIGFIATHGYWSWKLWSEFSNPFFPFFNAVFHSADFVSSNLKDERFLGTGLLGVATLPFVMMRSEGWIYNEVPSPDLRFAALAVLCGAALLVVAVKAKRTKSFDLEKKFIGTLVFFLISYTLWATISRIGRYGLPIFLLAGPIICAVAYRLMSQRRADLLISLLILAQFAVICLNNVNRATPVAWGGKWFDVQLPDRVRSVPTVFVTTQTQSMAMLASFVHRDSSFVNLTGMFAIASGPQMPKRLKDILRNRGVTLILSVEPATRDPVNDLDYYYAAALNTRLNPYGLKLDGSTCDVGWVNGRGRAAVFSDSDADDVPALQQLLFCRLSHLDQAQTDQANNEVTRFDSIFDSIEDRCYSSFEPRRIQTSGGSPRWSRTYFSTANNLYIKDGAVYTSAFHRLFPEIVGSVEALRERPESAICPRLADRYTN